MAVRPESEPCGEPVAYYFRDLIWRPNDVAHLDGLPPGFGGIS